MFYHVFIIFLILFDPILTRFVDVLLLTREAKEDAVRSSRWRWVALAVLSLDICVSASEAKHNVVDVVDREHMMSFYVISHQFISLL